jgi:hypothetical protein
MEAVGAGAGGVRRGAEGVLGRVEQTGTPGTDAEQKKTPEDARP